MAEEAVDGVGIGFGLSGLVVFVGRPESAWRCHPRHPEGQGGLLPRATKCIDQESAHHQFWQVHDDAGEREHECEDDEVSRQEDRGAAEGVPDVDIDDA